MIQAVVLGIGGVLAPAGAIRDAEIAAGASWLAARGHDALGFGRAAFELRGHPGWLPGALAAAAIHLAQADRRAFVLACRAGVPQASVSPHRAGLTALAGRCPVGIVEAGSRERVETWTDRLGLGRIVPHRLATGDLGRVGAPPRPAAFRFMSRRLDLRAAECLYVAGNTSLAAAASAAGWQVIVLETPAEPGYDWDALLPNCGGVREWT